MDFFEDAIFQKENEVLYMYYEHAEKNIVNSFFMETAGSDTKEPGKIQQIIAVAKRKIEEIIEKIKSFFQEIKTKHDRKKIDNLLKSEVANSQLMITSTINSKEIIDALDKVYAVQKQALDKMRKIHDDYKKGRIDLSSFISKKNEILEELSNAISEYNKTEKKVMKSVSKTEAVSIKRVTSEANKVVDHYYKLLDACRDEILREENSIHASLGNDSDHTNGSIQASSGISEIGRKVAIGLGAAAGIGAIIAWATRFSPKAQDKRMHKIEEDAARLKKEVNDDYKRNKEHMDQIFSYDYGDISDLKGKSFNQLEKELKDAAKKGDKKEMQRIMEYIGDMRSGRLIRK